MKKQAAAIIGCLVLSTAAMAEPVPPRDTLTSAQAQDLISGLRMLDTGSVEQCVKESKDEKGAPKACPYKKSVLLLRAMARNIVLLQPVDNEFKIQQNAIRLEVLDAVPSGPKQDATFFERMMKVYGETHQVPGLVHIKMSDLDLGVPPEHNQIPASVIAALAPLIDDFVQVSEK